MNDSATPSPESASAFGPAADAAPEAADPSDLLAELASRAEAGEATHVELVDAFLDATVYVPSVTDPEGGTIDPVITRVDEVDYMVVASTTGALEHTGDVARFGVPMNGRSVITGMNPELALMINLSFGAFAMPKAMLDDIRSRNPLG